MVSSPARCYNSVGGNDDDYSRSTPKTRRSADVKEVDYDPGLEFVSNVLRPGVVEVASRR